LKTITASKFRSQFTELLRDLSTGPVEVTKHGKVIAILTSPDSPVEALEEVETAMDTSEAEDAARRATEAEETLRDIAAYTRENNVLIKDRETQARIDSFDESEEEEEEGEDWSIHDDKAFEDYLSELEPDNLHLMTNYCC
jgi:prevent-host-death family protein